jgi:hypothetical protein
MNIPDRMCHIWIGPHPAPTHWMKTWSDYHPDWKYSVFDNQALATTQFKNQHLIDEYLRRQTYAGVADLIRYELLYEHGGFIPPADAVCLNNTNELWTEAEEYCYTVYEHETLRPGYVSPIYACNPGNHFVKIIIDTLNLLSANDLDEHAYKSTGNKFLADMINLHNPKIKIFPSHYFIPKHFKAKNPRYTGPDKIYADQMWGSTRKTYPNINK